MAIVKFNHRCGEAYAIQDETTKLYFIWCYKSEAFAELMSCRVYPITAQDQAVNWRAQYFYVYRNI